jgi:hypothetical protein
MRTAEPLGTIFETLIFALRAVGGNALLHSIFTAFFMDVDTQVAPFSVYVTDGPATSHAWAARSLCYELFDK